MATSDAAAVLARSNERLARVVSVVCRTDIDTWRVVSRQVLEHIAADEYIVAVPRAQRSEFEAATPAAYNVVPEDAYLEGHTLESIRNSLPDAARGRAGWYLQQFVKIGACSLGQDDSVNLIWDGDTVPLRRLRFIDDDRRLSFYTSSEHHAPYFSTLERLLGLTRAVDVSFIAQCMPVRARWVRELTAEIEARSSRQWIDAILACICGESPSEFSEYETLGQFVFQKYSGAQKLSDRPWHRFGNSLLGGIDQLTSERISLLAAEYDFVSFENWDVGQPGHGLRSMIGRFGHIVRRQFQGHRHDGYSTRPDFRARH